MDLRTYAITLVVGMTLLTAGCKTKSIPAHFAPLEQLVERPFGDNSFVTTLHTNVWVSDIDDYLKRHPEGSYSYNATMIHERIHSIRMGNVFTTVWFTLQYLFNTDFMWSEEQLGWYFDIQYKRSKGILKQAEYYAIVLAGYSNTTGKMITYNKALLWVRDVFSGNWKPNLTPEEWAAYAPPKETN